MSSPAGLQQIDYAQEPDLPVEEFIEVLQNSGLGERRPIHDRNVVASMLSQATLILTARSSGKLVGVARALTDFSFCTYLSDLAVDVEYQRRGIGRELIRQTHVAAGLKTSLILLAAPAAVDYYPHIGLQNHPSCWMIPGQSR
ncbi:MAG: GNAT family N-acetyltransferase [Planctomycetaceae bacterium]|nr:GNAT family N-acetyltransferase [Planctomycetaceae bacterium]